MPNQIKSNQIKSNQIKPNQSHNDCSEHVHLDVFPLQSECAHYEYYLCYQTGNHELQSDHQQ